MTTSSPRSILITGASSGIGEALAEEYAAPGVVLALSGRDRRRLDDVAERCRARGAAVAADTVDVTERAAAAGWIVGADQAHPLDLVVANAGISGGSFGGGEDEEQVRDIFSVNLAGVLNTVLPVVPAMCGRGRGQIAIMSSISALRGLPMAPAYAASKAAVKAWGEGLRPLLAEDGVRVSVICPGWVESRMTRDNDFPMPFIMPATRAARIIRRGLARDRPRIAFPFATYRALWLIAMLPPTLGDWLLKYSPRKRPRPTTGGG